MGIYTERACKGVAFAIEINKNFYEEMILKQIPEREVGVNTEIMEALIMEG